MAGWLERSKNDMYKTILVHLNDSRRANRILGPALELARRYEAHLIGLHVFPGIVLNPPVAMPYGGSVVGSAVAGEREESDKIRAVFEEATRNQPLVPEWREIKATHADLGALVLEHARTTDLIVAGQSDPDWDLAPVLDFPERLAMGSGRPVLVVPHAGVFRTVGERVTVAWAGRRESARAVFDALPLLKEAQNVQILTVSHKDEKTGDRAADTEIAAVLARHGVKVSTRRSDAITTGIADEILNRVADEGSDLIVMGAYGHSRLREFVFGGVTREITRHMTVPTLLSH
jgi:nucleotide-binding universal stress UspA family protein